LINSQAFINIIPWLVALEGPGTPNGAAFCCVLNPLEGPGWGPWNPIPLPDDGPKPKLVCGCPNPPNAVEGPGCPKPPKDVWACWPKPISKNQKNPTLKILKTVALILIHTLPIPE
jgi:hypothetical protein